MCVPVLLGVFSPLFDLLFAKTDLLWGGINYWDVLADDFYTEQFTRFNPSEDNGVVFRNAMNWILSKSASAHLLPMTTFIFERCDPPREMARFYKGELTPPGSNVPTKSDFFNRRAKVKLPDVENKQAIRESIYSASADMDKILTELSLAC